jgi:hypothetical protein
MPAPHSARSRRRPGQLPCVACRRHHRRLGVPPLGGPLQRAAAGQHAADAGAVPRGLPHVRVEPAPQEQPGHRACRCAWALRLQPLAPSRGTHGHGGSPPQAAPLKSPPPRSLAPRRFSPSPATFLLGAGVAFLMPATFSLVSITKQRAAAAASGGASSLTFLSSGLFVLVRGRPRVGQGTGVSPCAARQLVCPVSTRRASSRALAAI